MRHFTYTIVRNSVFGMGAQVAIKVLSFAFTILIVRGLGHDAFGQYAAVLAFGGIFAFLCDLGLSPYTVRQVARWRDTPGGRERIADLYASVLVLRLGLSLLAAGALIVTVVLLGKPLSMVGAVALSSCGLWLYSIQGTSDAVLAGFERLDIGARAKVASQTLFVCLGGGALFLHAGYYGLIAANLVSVVLLAVLCVRGVRRLPVQAGRTVIKQWPLLLRSSLPFGIIGFTLGLSYKFDTILLSQYRGDAETGYYNVAYSLVFATVVLSNVINTALYPALTRRMTLASPDLGEIYGRVLRYLLVVSLPIAVGGSILAPQIIPFLYGAKYAPAIPVLRTIIWVAPLMFVSEYLGYLVLIGGREAHAARAVLLSTSLNVAFNLALVPRFGLRGAAVMTVVTEAVLVLQYCCLLRRELSRVDVGQAFGRPLVAVIVMGGVVTLLAPYLVLAATIVLGAFIYGALLLLFRVIGSDEVRFVRGIRQPREVTP